MSTPPVSTADLPSATSNAEATQVDVTDQVQDVQPLGRPTPGRKGKEPASPVNTIPGAAAQPVVTAQASDPQETIRLQQAIINNNQLTIESLKKNQAQLQDRLDHVLTMLAAQTDEPLSTQRVEYLPAPTWRVRNDGSAALFSSDRTAVTEAPVIDGQVAFDGQIGAVVPSPPLGCRLSDPHRVRYLNPTILPPPIRETTAPPQGRPAFPDAALPRRSPTAYASSSSRAGPSSTESAGSTSFQRPHPMPRPVPTLRNPTAPRVPSAASDRLSGVLPTTDDYSVHDFAAPYGRWPIPPSSADDAHVLKLDTRISNFAGELHEDAFAWLRSFDNQARANRWYSWEARYAMLPKYLEGEAAEWWDENNHTFFGWHSYDVEPLDVNYFRGAFLSRFVSEDAFTRWSNELHSATQERDETPTAFCSRFKQLVSRVCLVEELSERTLARRMLLGVTAKISQPIVQTTNINQFRTLTEVENAIRRQVQIMYQLNCRQDTLRSDGPLSAVAPTEANGRLKRNATRFIPDTRSSARTSTRSAASTAPPRSALKPATRRREAPRPADDDVDKLTDQMKKVTIMLSSGRRVQLREDGRPVNACKRCGEEGHWMRECPAPAPVPQVFQ